ncbi:MAG: hypothetical protein JWN86_443 [Planctomycetota bacterium]|nr:hypothetical protein [Planctomycetota bacterium]
MNPQLTATWNAKQERVALLLAAGRSIKGAAKASEVGERTAHDWLADKDYRAFVAELRGRILNRAVGRLSQATNAAVGELVKLLKDESATVRLRAATAILDGAVRMREHVELDERMLAIEQQQK